MSNAEILPLKPSRDPPLVKFSRQWHGEESVKDQVLRMSDLPIVRERAEARSFVQIAFGGIAAFALAMSLAFQLGMLGGDLPADDIAAVTRAFLILGIVNTAMMFVWERLFPLSD